MHHWTFETLQNDDQNIQKVLFWKNRNIATLILSIVKKALEEVLNPLHALVVLATFKYLLVLLAIFKYLLVVLAIFKYLLVVLAIFKYLLVVLAIFKLRRNIAIWIRNSRPFNRYFMQGQYIALAKRFLQK